MSFELDRELMEFVHMNLRREIHGDEQVNGIDLRFRVELSNETIVLFSPTLKTSLWKREDTPQGDFEPESIPYTIVKNPEMGTIKWDVKYDCGRFVIHHGIDEKNDIAFALAKINKFSILPRNGARYVCEFRVQISDPDAADIAKLSAVLGQTIYASADSEGGEPEDEEQADFGASGNEGFAMPSEDLHADGDLPEFNAADFGSSEEEDDEFFKPAMEHVIREQKVSVSMIQKHCHIGFNRATRLVERMESQGIISAEDGKGKRTVLIPANMLADPQAASA